MTIGIKEASESGRQVLKLRPRSTAALLVIAGKPPMQAPRLSDLAAFERVVTSDGLVNFSELDQEGRIDGYSVPFIHGVLEALDPSDPIPPKFLKRLVPTEKEQCSCSSRPKTRKRSLAMSFESDAEAMALAEEKSSIQSRYSSRETHVPQFISELRAFSYALGFGDIVVSRNGTLILDADTNFIIAGNFLAYRGARIIQRGKYMAVDIPGVMRGSVSDIVHRAIRSVLKVDWGTLTAQAPSKP